jgi:hypothetical protein
VIATARKLAALLHRLWVSGKAYEPLRSSQSTTMREQRKTKNKTFLEWKNKSLKPSLGDCVNRLAAFRRG